MQQIFYFAVSYYAELQYLKVSYSRQQYTVALLRFDDGIWNSVEDIIENY